MLADLMELAATSRDRFPRLTRIDLEGDFLTGLPKEVQSEYRRICLKRPPLLDSRGYEVTEPLRSECQLKGITFTVRDNKWRRS